MQPVNAKRIKHAALLLLVPSATLVEAGTPIKMDCTPGRVDSTCAGPVWTRPGSPAETPFSQTFGLAGVPTAGYWFWGYDFQTPDADQLAFPLFVNRSGQALALTLGFTIPPAVTCNKDCLPGVIFYTGSGSSFPSMSVSGDRAEATLRVGPFDSYGWIIGLWQASNPTITITTDSGSAVTLKMAGLPEHPDQSSMIPGSIAQCRCEGGGFSACMWGDHSSNGLVAQWSRNSGSLQRLNAWNSCQREGG